MNEWPPHPLPHIWRTDTGRSACNEPLVWRGRVMGHCERQVKPGKPHRGPHRIEWK